MSYSDEFTEHRSFGKFPERANVCARSRNGSGDAAILVIDDDTQLRELLCHVLEREGYAVLSAANGRDGMRLFSEHPVDMVITDIVIPEQEGLETIRELRHGNNDVKIVAMSESLPRFQFDYLRVAELLGASRTILKPFRSEDLVEMVRETLFQRPRPAGRTHLLTSN